METSTVTDQDDLYAHHEIERKFIVCDDSWRAYANESMSERLVQGYIESPDATVRIRIASNLASGEQHAFQTLKGKRQILEGKAIGRTELEWEIPVTDAELALEQMCSQRISKLRHYVVFEGTEWTVDVFDNTHHQLHMAEIELTLPDECFAMPPFTHAQAEVTQDARFSNGYMADHGNDFSYLTEVMDAAKSGHTAAG